MQDVASDWKECFQDSSIPLSINQLSSQPGGSPQGPYHCHCLPEWCHLWMLPEENDLRSYFWGSPGEVEIFRGQGFEVKTYVLPLRTLGRGSEFWFCKFGENLEAGLLLSPNARFSEDLGVSAKHSIANISPKENCCKGWGLRLWCQLDFKLWLWCWSVFLSPHLVICKMMV